MSTVISAIILRMITHQFKFFCKPLSNQFIKHVGKSPVPGNRPAGESSIGNIGEMSFEETYCRETPSNQISASVERH